MTERKPPGVSWETWIDRQIREGMERGDFDGLAGPRQADRGRRPTPRRALVGAQQAPAGGRLVPPADAGPAQGRGGRAGRDRHGRQRGRGAGHGGGHQRADPRREPAGDVRPPVQPRCLSTSSAPSRRGGRLSDPRSERGASRGRRRRPRGGRRSGTARRGSALTQAPSSRQSGSRARRSPCFSRWTASGGLAAMACASSRAVGSSSSCGTTRDTSPSACASVGLDHPAGEQQLGGALPADELGQATDAGHVRAQAAVDEQLAELGALGRHPDVGHQGQLHAPAHGGPVDGRHDRDVGVQQRLGRRGEGGGAPQPARPPPRPRRP